MDDRDALLARIARLEVLVAEQAAVIAAQAARIAELEGQLKRRGKRFQPKPNAAAKPPKPDRRTTEFRKHPGRTRPLPRTTDAILHDVRVGAAQTAERKLATCSAKKLGERGGAGAKGCPRACAAGPGEDRLGHRGCE